VPLYTLACNASEKIIEPIQSRCAIVRFTRLSDQAGLVGTCHHVIQSRTRVMGWHFSPRYFAVKTPSDDSQGVTTQSTCNQSDTRE
jgi:hypothetical protein